MKKLEFFESLFLFLFTSIYIWVLGIPLFVMTIIAGEYGITAIFFFCLCFPFLLYPTLMSKITIDEKGVQKALLKKFKKQFFAWETIQDYVVVTRPNGYAYLVISQEKIKHTSFEEVAKDKKCLYFTYNQKAMDFIKEYVPLEREE